MENFQRDTDPLNPPNRGLLKGRDYIMVVLCDILPFNRQAFIKAEMFGRKLETTPSFGHPSLKNEGNYDNTNLWTSYHLAGKLS